MFLKTIARVSFVNIIITIVSVSFGMLLAFYFGASPQMDAYVVAANFIIALNAIFLRAQSKTFIPYISKYENDKSHSEIVASIVRFNFILFTILSLAIFAFSGPITFILAPGLDTIRHNTASKILKVLSIYILFSNFCGIGIGILEYNLKFLKSAFVALIQSISLLIILLLSEHFIGIYSIPLAHISSLLLITIIYLRFYLKSGYKIKTTLKLYNNYIKDYIHLLFPIIIASVFIWLIRITDTFIASFLDTGSLSYLSYCQRIITHTAVISNTVSVIYFPILSKLNEKKDDREFIDIFYKGLQTLFTITFSITLFILLFKKPIITLLFQRGNFTSYDTETISKLLNFYFFVFIGSPMGTYLANAYFCRQKAKMATIFSVISSLTNIIFNCILGFFFGIFGLASASSLAFLTGNIIQISNIYRFNLEYKLKSAINCLLKPSIAGFLTYLIFYYVKSYIFQYLSQGIIYTIVYIIIGLILYSILFFLFCLLFKVEFIIEVVGKTIKRDKRE